jgi:hypothetical protein
LSLGLVSRKLETGGDASSPPVCVYRGQTMFEAIEQSRIRLRELVSRLEGGIAAMEMSDAEFNKTADLAFALLDEQIERDQKAGKANLLELRAGRHSRWRTRNHEMNKTALAARCHDQPAGMPVYIGKPGLEVVLAPAYGNIEKKPKQMRKGELRRREEEAYKRRKLEEVECGKVPPAMQKRYWNRTGVGRSDYIRRHFWSNRLQAYVVIRENYKTGKCKAEIRRRDDESGFKAMLYMNTYEAASVYTVEAETKALECLKSKVTEEQFKRYFCTGMLIEKSKKSGLNYIFRRCRPILVLREIVHQTGDDPLFDDVYYRTEHHFVAALCIHPQGYYASSWAGTLVPTDDIVCQLLMMRTDEPKLWKKATQHDRHSPQADI